MTKRPNPITVSLEKIGKFDIEICDIKWASDGTPLIVSGYLGDWHYHHYFKNGKLTAHKKNNRTEEKIEVEAGISASISELIKERNLLRNN